MKSIILLGLALALPCLSFAQSWRPLSRTCDKYSNDVASSFLEMKVENFEALSDEEGMLYLKKNFENSREYYYNTFLVLISPSVNLAEKAIRLNLVELMKKTCGQASSRDSLDVILPELKLCLKNHFQNLKTSHTTFAHHADYLRTDSKHLQTAYGLLTGLCEKLSIERLQCKSDLLPFLTLINPASDSTKVTVPQEFFRISVEPELTQLAEEFSYYYIDRILAAHKRGVPEAKDVFQDLVNFFTLKGKSNLEARRLSLYFLGVYGVRGASFFLPYYQFHPKALSAMVLLSTGISYLDKLAMKQKKSYAIPHQYKNSCNVGKPYHFWMAAFVADYARKQGFSRRIGYFAPVISGIAYDFLMDANGRDIKKLFAIKTPYDNYATMTRLDNWARVMGAHFGKHQGKVLPINAEAILDQMFEKAKIPSKDPEGVPAQMLKEYIRIVQPLEMIVRFSL